MKNELDLACDRLFDVKASIRASFERHMGRPVGALSDTELSQAFDYARETQNIIAAEIQKRMLCARLRPASQSPAGTPVVARRDDAPIP